MGKFSDYDSEDWADFFQEKKAALLEAIARTFRVTRRIVNPFSKCFLRPLAAYQSRIYKSEKPLIHNDLPPEFKAIVSYLNTLNDYYNPLNKVRFHSFYENQFVHIYQSEDDLAFAVEAARLFKGKSYSEISKSLNSSLIRMSGGYGGLEISSFLVRNTARDANNSAHDVLSEVFKNHNLPLLTGDKYNSYAFFVGDFIQYCEAHGFKDAARFFGDVKIPDDYKVTFSRVVEKDGKDQHISLTFNAAGNVMEREPQTTIKPPATPQSLGFKPS